MNILMIYPRFPEENFWNLTPVVKLFTKRATAMPPLGLLTIASYLPTDFSIRLVDRNVAEETEADWHWADVIFLSAMLSQVEDFTMCVQSARMRYKPIAVGGPLTHAMPELALSDSDWICFGEAESIMEEFVADLRADRRGKQYQGGNETNMESVKLPRFDLIPNINDYVSMNVQFSRGCPFKCEFCDIIEIYGRVPRTKTPGQVLAEFTALKNLGFHGYVFLVDDNFIGNKKKAKLLLSEMAEWNRENGYPFAYSTEASLNLADDEELLLAMSRAWFVNVFIGIETPDPKLLKTTLKNQNIPGDPLEKLRRIRAHGIHIIAGFIVGFDGERRDVFDAQRSFIQASGVGIAMMGLLQAIPHTQLSRRLEKEGRLLPALKLHASVTCEGMNFVPKGEMTKREYFEGYRRLVEELYTPKAYFARILPAVLSIRNTPRRLVITLFRRQYPMFFRVCYHMGLKLRGARLYYWKTLLHVLMRNPSAVRAFAYDCFYFYRLREHALYVSNDLKQYLLSPSPDDVLDEVVRDSELTALSG